MKVVCHVNKVVIIHYIIINHTLVQIHVIKDTSMIQTIVNHAM
jgi:hypothetical protein